MSDDEADPELLALLRQSLGLGPPSSTAPPSTRVLKDAEYICDNSIDVAISPPGTKNAARRVWEMMQEKHYSLETWSEHELHPTTKDEAAANFVFTMNLLNFSFWSELDADTRFAVQYKDQNWTGYWSLVAALQRALAEGHPITTPAFWSDSEACSDTLLGHIFRSATDEAMPLLTERIAILRETADILIEHFDGRPLNLINDAEGSAARLVNLLVEYFPNFRDTTFFHGRQVRLLKRAQIMVADLWACFNDETPCQFSDISHLTTFPDYRIPQMLHSLGVLLYSPRLESKIKNHEMILSGSTEEVEIRGCTIWAVEMLRREIIKCFPEASGSSGAASTTNPEITTTATTVAAVTTATPTLTNDGDDHQKSRSRSTKPQQEINAVLIDFFLYDLAKEREQDGTDNQDLPHHRTRSIFY